MAEPNPEDAKLVVLARSSRARVGAAQGAAVRDTDGRTYAASTVSLPSLTLSALQVAIAMALASGAQGCEAAVVLGDPVAAGSAGISDAAGAQALAEWAPTAQLFYAAADGSILPDGVAAP